MTVLAAISFEPRATEWNSGIPRFLKGNAGPLNFCRFQYRLAFPARQVPPNPVFVTLYHTQSGKDFLSVAYAHAHRTQDICRTMPIDAEEYLYHLDGFDLSESEKVEFIHNVAAIMESFVDQAFGVHPVQQSLTARAARDSIKAFEAVESDKGSFVDRFESAADTKPQRQE